MANYLGIDVGTSGTKALVMNARGKVLATATAEHPIFAPKPGWSEQRPDDWWASTIKATRAVVKKANVSGKSIKGIGDTSATILLSIIGDIDDFESEGKLASYFGIVPRVRNSNETERTGRITKRGTKLGRTTLVQCSLIAMRYSRYLQRFFLRIASRRGKGKAIIALAKKFLGVIFKTLKNDWVFEDFPNFVIVGESP